MFTKYGFDKLPICMAKTHLSFTHDPTSRARRGAGACPSATCGPAWAPASSIRCAATMRTMPGLPTRPAFVDVDLDLATGKIKGLF